MPPELSDAVAAIEIGEQQDVEKLGRGWAWGRRGGLGVGPSVPLASSRGVAASWFLKRRVGAMTCRPSFHWAVTWRWWLLAPPGRFPQHLVTLVL